MKRKGGVGFIFKIDPEKCGHCGVFNPPRAAKVMKRMLEEKN